MDLKFTPCRMEERLIASVSGDTITLNGVVFDLSPLTEGDLLPVQAIGSPWFASDIERVGGVIRFTLRIPHGVDTPRETLFPENFDTYLTIVSGPVPIPAYEVGHD